MKTSQAINIYFHTVAIPYGKENTLQVSKDLIIKKN